MKKILRPYLFISLCGMLAFAPVSFMLRALKNDIVALEYPINYFMSQCLRNGELPYWFNTWGMGFPLQSNLTWGIYSTPQIFFSSAFNYNIYTLHIEFIFFILLSGWGMFYLLQKYFLKDEKLAVLFSICYMLSGFISGSTQWLLYVTAAAFIPLVISSLLNLLEKPTIKNSLQAAVCYTLMFTSVYAAFNIITTYSIAVFLIIWFWKNRKEKKELFLRIRCLLLAAFFTVLLCFPCLYFTFELLSNLDRGNGLASEAVFFNSNYLHPGALSTMLFPLSSVNMGYYNTEGTMLNTYAGLFVLTALPPIIFLAAKNKNKSAFILLAAALFFLLLSFGNITPLRRLLNVLPGFSYFRNPSIFRFYFLLSLILAAGFVLQKSKFEDLAKSKFFNYTLILLAFISLIAIVFSAGSVRNIEDFSVASFIRNATYRQTLLVSSIIQFFLIAILIFLIKQKKWLPVICLFAADLVINTLICTPFFSVSSYTPAQVNNILKSEKGFPLQKENPSDISASFSDEKENSWQNINVFTKKVSIENSYRGPLVLKNTGLSEYEKQYLKKYHLVFSNDDSAQVKLLLQKPTHIRAGVTIKNKSHLWLMQNYYPGWKAYVNNKEVKIIPGSDSFFSIEILAGDSVVDFKYERKSIWLSALLVHLAVIAFCIYKLKNIFRRLRVKSSSLS